MPEAGLLDVIELDNTKSVIDQFDALESDAKHLRLLHLTYTSTLATDTGMPRNGDYMMFFHRNNENSITVIAFAAGSSTIRILTKSSGSWSSSWESLS